jgi:hypothetical protein
VFRYNQVAGLAREAARWASVRGAEYRRQTNTAPVTASDLLNEVVLKKSVALDPRYLQCELNWGPGDSTVSVTLRYQWIPEGYFEGAVFKSTAVMFVSQ